MSIFICFYEIFAINNLLLTSVQIAILQCSLPQGENRSGTDGRRTSHPILLTLFGTVSHSLILLIKMVNAGSPHFKSNDFFYVLETIV